MTIILCIAKHGKFCALILSCLLPIFSLILAFIQYNIVFFFLRLLLLLFWGCCFVCFLFCCFCFFVFVRVCFCCFLPALWAWGEGVCKVGVVLQKLSFFFLSNQILFLSSFFTLRPTPTATPTLPTPVPGACKVHTNNSACSAFCTNIKHPVSERASTRHRLWQTDVRSAQ